MRCTPTPQARYRSKHETRERFTRDAANDKMVFIPPTESTHNAAMSPPETFHCDNCDRTVEYDEAIRQKTMGGLDPDKWQLFCCDSCGSRLKTVFVGDE